jgi:predicted RecB family nuclease
MIGARCIVLITNEVFNAFLYCETKSYLKSLGNIGHQSEYIEWEQCRFEDFRKKCVEKLRSNGGEDKYIFDRVLQAQELLSRPHALERFVNNAGKKHDDFSPIRFVPSEKPTKYDKLSLAFDMLVLSIDSGQIPLYGKLIYGSRQRVLKVKLDGVIGATRNVIGKISIQQANPAHPQVILNKHCPVCEYQSQCRQVAIEKDDLTLLSSLTEKERKHQHNKGIFTVTQLSYTFRSRRKPKRLASKPEKYSYALKALAIRERKIYIAGKPNLNIKGNLVFLDVEGDSLSDFYYLIGMRIKTEDSYIQHSFWANEKSEEKDIWNSFFDILSKIENPQLIYYGHYEKVFLKKMKERYSITANNALVVDQFSKESINLLSVIYSQIYFPTYSNGLKDIARYLGFQWSEEAASGLNALVWRNQWELSKNPDLKQKLITYNAEDCEALEKGVNIVAQLCQEQTEESNSPDNNVIYTNSLKRESLYRLKKNKFLLPELEYINQSAYWDYQRDKIYIRSSQRLKQVSRKAIKKQSRPFPVNKIVECEPPTCCPKCGSADIHKHAKQSKTVYDLKFNPTSIKRWTIKFCFNRYRCFKCRIVFSPKSDNWTRSKYGTNLIAYMFYQNLELRLSQRSVIKSLNQLLGFNVEHNMFIGQKTRVAQMYQETYEKILKKLLGGELIHTDETKISIEGKSAYVWVFTSLEEVVYIYKETREGDFLHELLREFKGVLVSDFYAAYDSVDCPQQKCLIHLVRDLNDETLKSPFDEELKELTQEFAMLLKPIIETIDRFGLKAHFLKKHKVSVERFYKALANHDYKSEAALKCKKRFEKYHNKLFTFLDYDGIPWNNNNAEHTIKSFAMLRNVIGGTSTDKGIREYLILFSIYETCKYKGVSFLEFLRSEEKDIDNFIING